MCCACNMLVTWRRRLGRLLASATAVHVRRLMDTLRHEMDRADWRSSCKSAVEKFKMRRIQELESKRESGPTPTSNFECQICQRMCRSRIGLLTHNKSHSWWWDPSRRRLSPWRGSIKIYKYVGLQLVDLTFISRDNKWWWWWLWHMYISNEYWRMSVCYVCRSQNVYIERVEKALCCRRIINKSPTLTNIHASELIKRIRSTTHTLSTDERWFVTWNDRTSTKTTRSLGSGL